MIKVSKIITINGVEVNMLFTPRLFVMAAEQGLALSLDGKDRMTIMAAYADLCYCAALNSWTMDNDLSEFPFKRADFHKWSAENQAEFSKVMILAAEAITGKTMKELVQEQTSSAENADSDVKKKKSSLIMRWLRRS